MSNFICEHCGARVIEGEGGRYVSGCEHYPLIPLGVVGAASRVDLFEHDMKALVRHMSDLFDNRVDGAVTIPVKRGMVKGFLFNETTGENDD